jgi:hypothetical protein
MKNPIPSSRLSLLAALLVSGLLGCSTYTQAQSLRATPGRTAESLTFSDKEQARELLASADRQIQNLRGMLERTIDPEARSAIEAQIQHISASRDRLLADVTMPPSAFVEEGRFAADASNLRHAIEGGAATEMQRPR